MLPDEIARNQAHVERLGDAFSKHVAERAEVTFAHIRMDELEPGRVYELRVRVGFDEKQAGDIDWPYRPRRERTPLGEVAVQTESELFAKLGLRDPRIAPELAMPSRRMRRGR